VSELSGRGVGLDVVLKSIERLNGLVQVESVSGVGSKFIIELPLTLAIISALLIEVSGRVYAVPLGSVIESVKFHDADVQTISGRATLRLRDEIVPLLALSTMFSAPTPGDRQYAVVLGRGDKRLGLVVDRLRGQQEVVIKALDVNVAGRRRACPWRAYHHGRRQRGADPRRGGAVRGTPTRPRRLAEPAAAC
jgi:two-component system chemotaxis sensor kinase CheA